MLLLDIDNSILFDEATMRTMDKPTLLVERLDGNKQFMTMRAHLRLKRLVEINQVIPVTNRTVDQFKHLELFQIDAKPKWAILESGKILLKEGKSDKRYENWLRQHQQPATMSSILIYLEEVEVTNWQAYPAMTLSERLTRPHEGISFVEDESALLEELFHRYQT
ncbi:hypothetical protein [Exiguobacterium oxidotolerans]|uniref:Haloacid dehalogenase n=1 Tax=Exiguobacterium oxidotolerans TaxID=223958 RepID=A0A653ICU6_9BACL|nr:hypothetical protein [Exiguobacterium oxidotolerans]VWX36734.1 conserved hypothetical protein [Exiguobacterium oxidotolerans]